MGKKLRVAVCGAGAFGRCHLQAYAARDDVELVGVADPDGARAAEVARHFATTAFHDPEVMLAATQPDAVSVVTATSAHAGVATAAIDAGAHVLLEKPVADTADQALALARRADDAGVVLMPGHVLRFVDAYREARASVRGGAVGRVEALVARRDRPRRLAEDYDDHPALLTMIHDIDQLVWYADGVPAVAVRALAALPRVVLAQVELASGMVASLTTAYCAVEGESDRLDVYGDAGVRSVEVVAPDGLAAEIDHFVDCARAGTPSSVVDMADAVAGLRIAEAVVASAARGGEVVRLA